MGGRIDLLFRGARVVDAEADLDAVRDVAVAGDKITAVEPEISPGRARRVIEARGLALLPGMVDSHVHMVDGRSRRSAAHARLARAGVTTAVEFSDMRGVLEQWAGSSAGLTVLGLQALPAYDGRTRSSRIRDDVGAALRDGCIGVKIFGGHYPSTPAAAAQIIGTADDLGVYVAFHAGTTEHGSDLAGMREAVELAGGRSLHIAHTNAYLRGLIHDPLEENRAAIQLLRDHPRVVSEAHLGPLNMCFGRVRDGELDDHIVRNCLRLRGYPPDLAGLRQAFLDGFAHAFPRGNGEPVPVTGEQGLATWRSDTEGSILSFPVNLRMTAYLQTCARVGDAGDVRYEGPGDFVVDAISSDGGLWRNVILDQGLTMVQLGALSLVELVRKACRQPAALFGLNDKGHLNPGADADLVGVDLDRRRVEFTVAAGQMIYDGERITGTGGTVLTSPEGTEALDRRGIPHRAIDLADSLFRRRR
ncbi:MAG: amidohydrolase family protein [Streptosporangiales bacterium]|nr:amidohydrolase family protein [Streptosporangiales bacterium]